VQARRLLQGLLKPVGQNEELSARQALAVASLQEVKSVDREVRRQVTAIIPDLLPPQSMEQAEQLAAVGTELIPLLAPSWARDSSKADEVIRTASLIGGSAALELISDVVKHMTGGPVAIELARAWQYFDAEKFARDVLSANSVSELWVGGARQLNALKLL